MVTERVYEPYGLSMWELSKQDQEAFPAWFADVFHLVPVWPPMAVSRHPWFNTQGMTYGLEQLSYPLCKGTYTRMAHCYYVITARHASPEESKQREPLFRERIRPFVEDFPKIWEQYKAEMQGYYEKLDPVDVTKLSDIELASHVYELHRLHQRAWEVHYYLMYALFCPYILFEEMARELVGIDDTSPVFQKLMAGFDNMVFRIDRMMWQLAQRASELGLADTILAGKAEKMAPALGESEAGRRWFAEINEFVKAYGKRMGQMINIASPTWVEDMSFPILRVQSFLRKGGSFKLDEQREIAIKERGEAEREVLGKVPEAERAWFEMLLRCAQNSSSWSEEHEFYLMDHCDFLAHNCIAEFGTRFARAGAFDQADDIWYVTYDDLLKIMHAPERFNMRPRVQDLRARWEGYRKTLPPPVITKWSMEQAFGWMAKAMDPILTKVVFGVLPAIRPELKADLYGTPGNSGVVEGTARVIMGEAQFGEIQPGDILVAPCTTVGWTCIFPLLSGVVVDRGGSLAHAAICSREYGIPCVLNTFEGTNKIKSGHRIKVDANLGAVWILS